MTKSIIAGACAAISLSMGADAGFTGYTVERVVTAAGMAYDVALPVRRALGSAPTRAST